MTSSQEATPEWGAGLASADTIPRPGGFPDLEGHRGTDPADHRKAWNRAVSSPPPFPHLTAVLGLGSGERGPDHGCRSGCPCEAGVRPRAVSSLVARPSHPVLIRALPGRSVLSTCAPGSPRAREGRLAPAPDGIGPARPSFSSAPWKTARIFSPALCEFIPKPPQPGVNLRVQ